jgi:hypothetical protein
MVVQSASGYPELTHSQEDDKDVEPDRKVRNPSVVLQCPNLRQEEADDDKQEWTDYIAELELRDLYVCQLSLRGTNVVGNSTWEMFNPNRIVTCPSTKSNARACMKFTTCRATPVSMGWNISACP